MTPPGCFLLYTFATSLIIVNEVLPSCWDPSPPEGGSILARGRFSCGCHLSHWPVRRQEGGDNHKAANDTASYVEKGPGRKPRHGLVKMAQKHRQRAKEILEQLKTQL